MPLSEKLEQLSDIFKLSFDKRVSCQLGSSSSPLDARVQTQLHEVEIKKLQIQHGIKLVKAQACFSANYSAKTVGRQHFGFVEDYLCTHLR